MCLDLHQHQEITRLGSVPACHSHRLSAIETLPIWDNNYMCNTIHYIITGWVSALGCHLADILIPPKQYKMFLITLSSRGEGGRGERGL